MKPGISIIRRLVSYAWIFAFAGLLGVSRASGQGEAPEIPEGPYVKAAPTFSQWVITYTYPEDRDKTLKPEQIAALNPKTKTITTTKTRNVIHEEYVDTKGSRGGSWYVGTIQYLKPAGTTIWYQAGASDSVVQETNPIYTPLPASGFRHLEWVTRETYAGTVSYGGKSCLVFVPGGVPKLDLNPATQAEKIKDLKNVVFIDQDTRYPVEVRNGDEIAYYQIKEMPPTSANPLPPDLMAQLAQAEAARARLDRPLARPY